MGGYIRLPQFGAALSAAAFCVAFSGVAAWAIPFFAVDTTSDSVAVAPGSSPKDASGRVSLRSAIMAANAQGGAVVDLQPSATYTLALVPPAGDVDLHDAATGDLDIKVPLTINGHSSVVDGAGIDRVFAIESVDDVDIVVNISDLTVANGAPKGFQRAGGGINVRAATLNLARCVVRANTTALTTSPANGGGIAANGVNRFPGFVPATLNLTGCTVSGNTANNGGGIVAGDCLLTLDASVVSNNTSTGTVTGVGGGGIFLTGSNCDAVIRNGSMVSGNTSLSEGGGVSVFSATLNLVNSTVSGNRSRRAGGGIADSAISPGSLIVSGSTISGNDANISVDFPGDGGGIYSTGPCALTNSTVSGNHARYGGGIFGFATLNSVTVTANSATAGGGLYPAAGSAVNTLIAANTAPSGPDVFGTLSSLGYNLVGNTAQATVTGVNTGNLLNVPPMLGPLAYNGGQTLTHALLPGSLAIDAGPPSGYPATDQRGVARPQNGNNGSVEARADIGAYEYVAPYTMLDAARALRIAGGLLAAIPTDMPRLNVEAADGQIRMTDALRIARKAAGLDANP